MLTALCLALYLPGLSTLPPVDRDEARFMQTTRQMVESGDFVRPRFQAEDRFRKPAGIYWLQSLSLRLTSGGDLTHVWPYRLPSVAGGLGAVLLTYGFGAMWYARTVALTGAALLAASLLLVVEAHLATTDAALLTLIVAAQGCLGMLYLAAQHGRRGSAWYAAGFWLTQGAAMLIKGPVAPLISALTIIALTFVTWRATWLETRRRREGTPSPAGAPDGSSGDSPSTLFANLRWHWGVALMLLVVLPWAIAIAGATDGAFFQQWWHGDVLPKLVGGHESHGAPPGTHLFMLPATFWPGSLALIPALLFVRTRRRAVERFCLAWIVPAWLVFELAPTKLPHYILPLLPPLALLCARATLSGPRLPRGARAAIAVWSVLGTLAALALVAGPITLDGDAQLGAMIGAGGVFICTSIATLAALARRWQFALPACVAASLVLSITTLGALLPDASPLWMSRSAAHAIATHAQSPTRAPLAAAGYHEPSLVFLAGGDVQLVDADGLAAFMERHPDGLGLISADERVRFDHAAAARGLDARVLWSMDGIHYSKGRRTRLLLLASTRHREAVEGGDAAPIDHQALVAR